MNRILKDIELIKTKAHAAAAASASTASIEVGPGMVETMQAQIVAPAVPALVDAKTIIFTFEDSADDSTFAAIPELATLTQLGAGGAGAAAATRTVYLPPSVRKYVRVTAAVLAAGGDNTAVSFTFQLLS